jgi:hypothetical protein
LDGCTEKFLSQQLALQLLTPADYSPPAAMPFTDLSFDILHIITKEVRASKENLMKFFGCSVNVSLKVIQ